MRAEGRIEARVSRRLPASAERVFDAWLAPEKVRRWMAMALSGHGLPAEVRRVEIDARVGGRFIFSDERPEGEAVHWGTYLEIERPRRLVFTWFTSAEEEAEDASTVELTLEPDGDGCIATIVHTMDARWAEYRERTEGGWARMLEAVGTLESAAAPRTAAAAGAAGASEHSEHGVLTAPGTIRFERRLPGPIERVWAYVTESEKRAKWLAAGEMELRVGGRVEHVFRNSELTPHDEPPPGRYANLEPEVRFSGRITACDPPRLLAYTWAEEFGESEVRFELTPVGEEVQLVLTHERLATRDLMLSVAGGWHTHLAILDAVLRGQTPPGFWSTYSRLEAEYERRLPAG